MLLIITIQLATSGVHAAAVYDSGGFESPRFVAELPLAGQDPAAPVGQGPWQQDTGTATATEAFPNRSRTVRPFAQASAAT